MNLLPSALAFMAFTLWSCGDALIKLASLHGATAYNAVFVLGGGTLGCLLIKKIIARKSIKELWPHSPKLVFLRAAVSVLTAFCFINAYILLTLSEAYVVEFLAPFLITIGAFFFMGEALTKQKLMIIILGFVGCIVAVAPELFLAYANGQTGTLTGYSFVIVGVVLFSVVQLMSRQIVKTEQPDAILAIACIGLAIFGAVGLIVSGSNLEPIAYWYLLPLPLVNVCAALMMLHAHKIGAAANVSVFHYWQLVMGALFGFFIWDTLPTHHLVAGSILVVISGIVMMAVDRKERLRSKVIADSIL